MIKESIVFILIVIAIAIFYFGMFVGKLKSSIKIKNAILEAFEDSDLDHDQKIEILDKMIEGLK